MICTIYINLYSIRQIKPTSAIIETFIKRERIIEAICNVYRCVRVT
jgi:hypothetical protein